MNHKVLFKELKLDISNADLLAEPWYLKGLFPLFGKWEARAFVFKKQHKLYGDSTVDKYSSNIRKFTLLLYLSIFLVILLFLLDGLIYS